MSDATTIVLANAVVEKRFASLVAKFYEDKGIVGPVGKSGIDGKDGLKGDKGDTGSQGLKGENGPQGLKGDKGDRGSDGKDGVSIKGDKGDKGDPGLGGKDGKGITNLAVTEEGSVIVQFTDGNTSNIGKAQVNNVTNVTGGRGGLPVGFFAVHSVSVEGYKLRIRCNNNKVFEVELPSGGVGSGPADWNTLLNKPTEFPPSAHTHVISDTVGLESALNGKQPAGSYATAVHTHTITQVTNLQTALDGKQPLSAILTNTTASFTTADEIKLDDIATGATVNSSDAVLLSRANHTGTQLANTISDFNTAVAATPSVTANTAKVSNATHTGDVTGSTVLTIANNVVSNAKLSDMVANTIKGALSAGDPVDLTATQARTILNVADGATANSSDASLRDRANHTGTQTASTISDFNTTADSRISNASINALSDVIITTPVTGQVVKYNGTNWVNGTDATGGGGTPVAIEDEGVSVTASVAVINFVGAGVTVTGGTTATVTIPGGSGGSYDPALAWAF